MSVLRGLLALIVAAAAAVLSFNALDGLALQSGYGEHLAWLYPILLDAGAAGATMVWLDKHAPQPARNYARTLALGLLGASIAGNAVYHVLQAFGLTPAWWLVVAVSAVAPGVLGAVIHLVNLTGRTHSTVVDEPAVVQPQVSTSPPAVEPDPPVEKETLETELEAPGETAEQHRDRLLAAGVGREVLMRELGLDEWPARKLLEAHRKSLENPAPELEALERELETEGVQA